jgi:hypothetical protein
MAPFDFSRFERVRIDSSTDFSRFNRSPPSGTHGTVKIFIILKSCEIYRAVPATLEFGYSFTTLPVRQRF